MMLRVGSTRTEVNRGRHIIETETFSSFLGDLFGLFDKVVGAVNVVLGLANQWF